MFSVDACITAISVEYNSDFFQEKAEKLILHCTQLLLLCHL